MPTDSILADSVSNLSNCQLKRLLKAIGACGEGTRWLGTRGLTTAWAECPRGDQLLWAVTRIGVDRRLIVRAAAACAETALQAVPEGEDRPRLAIEAARAWADDPSERNRRRARDAAAAADASAAAASYAAYAASYAASYAAASAAYAAAAASSAAYAASYAAAASAAYAAAAASSAASAAAYAASGADGADARTEALKRCAAIVREHIPFEAVLIAARQELGRRP